MLVFAASCSCQNAADAVLTGAGAATAETLGATTTIPSATTTVTNAPRIVMSPRLRLNRSARKGDMASTAYQSILVDEADGVVTITFNRPDRMNAYTWRMGAETWHAIWEADARDDVRAIVVTGAGRAFCAGADLESGGDTFTGRSGGSGGSGGS